MNNIISFAKIGFSVELNRAAFYIGNFPIYWYGIIIATGLLLAIWYGFCECKKTDINSDDFLNMIFIAVPVAIISARLYYVIFSWDAYKNDLLSILDIRSGGLAIFGGIIGASAVVVLYCRKKKISIGKVLDILAIGLLIGQSVGRWGNFVNGEAFGTFTSLPWAMTVESDGKIITESVHPTFLYESLWNGIGIIVLLAYKRIKEYHGELFCGYLVWYGFGRMIIESLRADSLYIGDIRVSQLIAAICIIAGTALILYKRIKCIEQKNESNTKR